MKYYRQYGVLQMIRRDILARSKDKLDQKDFAINIKWCFILNETFSNSLDIRSEHETTNLGKLNKSKGLN